MKQIALPISLGLAVLAGASVALSAAPKPGNFEGPHPILLYKNSSYIAVRVNKGPDLELRFYRKRDSGRWQHWGSTFVKAGQNKSNGSYRQNIWFKGHQVGVSDVDLRHASESTIGGPNL